VAVGKISVNLNVSVWESCTLIVEPMGVKFGVDEWLVPNFTPSVATCHPGGATKVIIAL